MLKPFTLGKLVATSAVAEIFAPQVLFALIARYRSGDWGNLCEEDKRANELAIQHGGRIVASYLLEDEKLYVITEADRSVTTILFAYEY